MLLSLLFPPQYEAVQNYEIITDINKEYKWISRRKSITILLMDIRLFRKKLYLHFNYQTIALITAFHYVCPLYLWSDPERFESSQPGSCKTVYLFPCDTSSRGRSRRDVMYGPCSHDATVQCDIRQERKL